jgi:hypothetical protein
MHNVTLPNLADIPFGREHADTLAALLDFDVRSLAPQQCGQYRHIGSDPCEYYMLPDGRVVLNRSRQFRGLSQIVIFADRDAWAAWRAADAAEETFWGVAD